MPYTYQIIILEEKTLSHLTSVTKSTSARCQNIVVYGIEENPLKTPKATSLKMS